MNSDSAIKNFTRGGQVLLHNLRMINQIASRVGLLCLIFFILLSIGFSWIFTSTYEQYLTYQYCLAKFNSSISDYAKQAFINPSGLVADVYSKQILTAEFIQHALIKVIHAVEKSIFVSAGITLLIFYILFRLLRKHGQNQAEVEEVREGISYGESAMRSGISISRQQSHNNIVNPSEVMRLNDLEAYIRVPGDFLYI